MLPLAHLHPVKPFYRYTKLSDECRCGSGHDYKSCCFQSELWGFIVGALLITLTLILPADSWALRIVRAIMGLTFWFLVVDQIRGWFAKRRNKTEKQEHDGNHVANTSVDP